MGSDKCSKVAPWLIWLAGVFAILGVILKVMGKSTGNVANLLIVDLSPDAFLRAANTTLFFSIALSLVRIVGGKEKAADSE